jgi:hypothetical protein
MQHWIAQHVRVGWILESVQPGYVAVMVGGTVRQQKLHLIVDEAGGLSYGAGQPAHQIMLPPQPRLVDDSQNHWVWAIAITVAVFIVMSIGLALLRRFT